MSETRIQGAAAAGASAGADFLADSAVSAAPGRAGLYRAALGTDWNAAVFPFGGMVSAIALRALHVELADPAQQLRTATTIYSSPVESGELEIETAVLRRGRGMSQLLATVRNAGSRDAGHTTLAVFGAAREERFAFEDADLLDAPPPEACAPFPVAPPGHFLGVAPFFQQVEVRVVRMRFPWEPGWEPGRAEAVRWFRLRRPARLADGRTDPLWLVTLADTMPPAITQKLGPGAPPFFAPSCDLTIHMFRVPESDWLLLRSRCLETSDGFASTSNEIFDESRRLCCRAVQMMYLRFEGTPPPRAARP